jgi:hypothetical protein
MQQIDGRPTIVNKLVWRRDRSSWLLLADRRRVGRVVPDDKHPGMWRPALANGRLGDMANLSWAKGVTLAAAERELDCEHAANAPSKCPEKRGVFEGETFPARFDEAASTSAWAGGAK